jgi:hypothetical protein
MNKELKLLLLVACSIVIGLSALSVTKNIQGSRKALMENLAELAE